MNGRGRRELQPQLVLAADRRGRLHGFGMDARRFPVGGKRRPVSRFVRKAGRDDLKIGQDLFQKPPDLFALLPDGFDRLVRTDAALLLYEGQLGIGIALPADQVVIKRRTSARKRLSSP